MALPTALNDREYRKFEDVGGEPAVRVTGQNFSGTFSVSGLKIAGRVTEVLINSTTWTALPAVPLANRNAVAIQNYTGQLIKINYSNSVSGFVGVAIPDQVERFYDITPEIIQYAKCASGSVTIIVEELS
jgi:hypothetical protein